jgi:two-component SAPR family response regulator
MIIDIRMPKFNGFDLYRELKKKDGSVKVCFLSAYEIYYEEFRKMFPTIDVRAFIRKPVSSRSTRVSEVNTLSTPRLVAILDVFNKPHRVDFFQAFSI